MGHPAMMLMSLLVAPTSVMVQASRQTPEKPHHPLAVHVCLDPEQIHEEVGKIPDDAVESVRETLESETDWFRLVKDRQEAEVVVEIVKEWTWRGTEGYVGPQLNEPYSPGSPPMQRRMRWVPDKHYIEAHLALLGKRIKTMTGFSENVNQPKTFSGSIEDKRRFAAIDLTRRVLQLCKENYWTLLDLQLILAAWQGNTGHARSLLEAGADANAKDNDGVTALMWAVISNDAETVRLLLGAGANLHTKANDGSTALLLAADNSEIQALLESAARN